MKKLNSTNNSHLKLLYDCMGNQKLQLTCFDTKREVPFYIGQDDRVTIYSSGALVEHWQNNKTHVAFIDNNGQKLVDVVEQDLQAVVFDSGVLVAQKCNNNKYFLQYYTYSGELIVAGDVKNLANKITEFEQEKGIFSDGEQQIL